MSTFDCAENLICATLSGSDGIGVGVVTGTPNKIVVSASNIPNSSLANPSININGTTIALGSTGSLAIGDITDVSAGTNLTGGGSSGSVTLSLTSSITGGLDSISGIGNIYATALTATNIQVLGTASIAMLNTVSQSELKIGDKYIIIMSGATDHVSLSGSGMLWGSGSTGVTIGPNGENAYVRYDSTYDQLVIFPGLKVSGSLTASNGGFSGNGSNITNISTTNITNFNSTVQGLLTGSSNITVANGTASLNSSVAGLSSLSSSYITGTYISGAQVSGSFSGSLLGTASYAINAGNALTASYVSTGSAIATFTNDVRTQFSQGTGIVINSGVISASNIPNSSLQNTGSTIGTTAIILGNTTFSLAGLTNLSSSAISGTNITASTVSASVGISSSLGLYTNLTATFITGTNISGTSAQYTSLTGSNISGTNNLLVGGNVGIATSTPATKLEISGAHVSQQGLLKLNSSIGSTAAMTFYPENVYAGAIFYDTDDKMFFGTQTAKSVNIYTSGTNNTRLTIDETGRVGIGTTDLGAKLTVIGSSSNDVVPEFRISGSNGKVDFYNSLDNNNYNSIVETGDKAIIFTEGTQDTGDFVIAPWVSTGTKGIRITSNGDVGIGVSAPSTTLHVNGNISGTYLELSTNLPSSSAHINRLFATDIPKAWGRINIADPSSIKVLDGSNIRAVRWDSGINALNLTLYFDLNDSGSFNSQINFLSTASFNYYINGPPNLCLATMVSRSTNTICVKFWDIVNGSEFIPSNETGREVYLDFNYFQRL